MGQGWLSGLPVTRCLLTQNHWLAIPTTASYPQVAVQQSLLIRVSQRGLPVYPAGGHRHTHCFISKSWLARTAMFFESELLGRDALEQNFVNSIPKLRCDKVGPSAFAWDKNPIR